MLVIDDDQDHREILAEALAYYQFKVKVLDSGNDLKRILLTFKPAVLLLDYRLPCENGIPFDLDLLIDHVNDLLAVYQRARQSPRLSID